ncbi:50S ribosomal protein L32 [Streptomyces halobius]|uniref:Large ribosomal subunit protein bL32 n=1 Tax=Streptomyces halobius TaxID=2879846 RepID=A0ABY4LZ88_9ACTN|nr:50S ribosomal protein L32 [Streptomyces halobius]UQA90819.1 50S ribosomal protein L32 [Streptomyces halobius]
MAVRKRKISRSNTRHRRGEWQATTPRLRPVTVDGSAYSVPRRVAAAYERALPRPEDSGS